MSKVGYIQEVKKASGKSYYYYRAPSGDRVSLGTDKEKATKHASQMMVYGLHRYFKYGELKAYKQSLRRLLSNSKARAKKTGRKWDLNKAFISKLFKRQNYKCKITGIDFRYEIGTEKGFRNPYAPSLDRIDAEKGYEKNNVRLVLTVVNYAMSDWGDDVFYEMMKGALAQLKREQNVKLSKNCKFFKQDASIKQALNH